MDSDRRHEIELITEAVLDQRAAQRLRPYAAAARLGHTSDEAMVTGDLLDSHRTLAPLTDTASLVRSKWRRRVLRLETTPDPRHHSVVMRYVPMPASALIDTVEAALEDRASSALRTPNARFDVDPEARTLRCRGVLAVPRCFPAIPVWLRVVPWWREQAALTLELRSTRRWRYPLRYFDEAHQAVDDVLDAAVPRFSDART